MKLIYLLGFIFFTNCCFAQTDNNDFTLGVTAYNLDELAPAQQLKVAEKLALMVNHSNEAIVGFYRDIHLYPLVSVEEASVVEGGMQNINVVTLEVTLLISQISSEISYNSMAVKIKGSGNTKEQAISNAISRWDVTDTKYTMFIKATREKIIQYYKDNCSRIVKNASDAATIHDYEQAVSLLESIPKSAPCFEEARKKSLEYYLKYQTKLCATNINIAKGEIAVKNYDDALEALEEIDPQSNCAAEVKKLINQISDKVTKQDKQDYTLEEKRINAIKEIGKAYFSSKASHEKSKKR